MRAPFPINIHMRVIHSSLALLGILLTSGLSTAASISIGGSDLLDSGVVKALKAQLAENGIEANIAFEGSLSAKEGFTSGTVDACLIAVPDGTESGLSGKAYLAGFQAVAFAVHSTNPLEFLTYKQLTDLFQRDGETDDWAQLVDDLSWQDRKISLWASRSDRAITLEIFNAVVLDGRPLKSSIRYKTADAEQLIRVVELDASSLLVGPVIETSPFVRLLAIKRTNAEQAYTPSIDNIFYGDYPLRLPFQLVIADTVDAETARKLVQAIYSDSVGAAMLKSFYVPLPESERIAVLSQLD